jgi:queuine/archaeosine tRNA-ribosyltransferase
MTYPNPTDKSFPADEKLTGYDWMGAAVDFLYSYESLGIRYEKNPSEKAFTRAIRDGIHIFYYPDRTIYRMRSGVNHAGIPDVPMDEVMEYSPLSAYDLYANLGLRYMMISPPHMNFTPSPLRNGKVRIIADSGGFQLRRGVMDFIDPQMLINFYNKTNDFGVGLDVPMNPRLFDTRLTRMANVTARNGSFLKANANKAVRIYDLNHGTTLEHRRSYMEVTNKYAPLDGLAIGGTSSNVLGESTVAAHLIRGMVSVCYIIDKTRDRYHTAHILGTTTPFWMFFMNAVTAGGFYPHLTSDSSTWAQSGIMNRQVMSTPGGTVLFNNQLPKDGIFYQNACSCPACNMVRYSPNFVINARANMMHALHYYAYLQRVTRELAEAWIRGDMSEKALEPLVIPSAFDHRQFRGFLRFLKDLLNYGFDKAYAKNSGFLQSFVPIPAATRGHLFTKKTQADMVDPKDAARTDSILASYEKWQDEHGIADKCKKLRKG